jgi:hypothetical protein
MFANTVSILFLTLGRTISPKRHLLGNNGLVQFDDGGVDLRVAFDEFLQNGFPHHVCVAQGRHADDLASLAKQCDVKVLHLSRL